jgi:REP element-mobilizing transposase RayT
MTTDLERRFRQSLRLKGYDYSLAGAYFVTIVAQNRLCLFGTIENEAVVLSPAGEMLQAVWQTLPTRFPKVVLDAFVVMPNHFHAIIVFPAPLLSSSPGSLPANSTDAEQKVPTRGTPTDDVPRLSGAEQRVSTRDTPTERPTLGAVVGAWKSLTTVEYIAGVKTRGWMPFAGRLWQRNYYEHVVRDDDDLARIRYYIATNPRYWMQDAENPQRIV